MSKKGIPDKQRQDSVKKYRRDKGFDVAWYREAPRSFRVGI